MLRATARARDGSDASVDNLADSLRDTREGLITIEPGRDRFAITRQRLQMRKRRPRPVYRTKNDRNDDRGAILVTPKRRLHLDVVGIIRGEKIRADEKKNDASRIHVRINLRSPFLPSLDRSIVPAADETLALQE